MSDMFHALHCVYIYIYTPQHSYIFFIHYIWWLPNWGCPDAALRQDGLASRWMPFRLLTLKIQLGDCPTALCVLAESSLWLGCQLCFIHVTFQHFPTNRLWSRLSICHCHKKNTAIRTTNREYQTTKTQRHSCTLMQIIWGSMNRYNHEMKNDWIYILHIYNSQFNPQSKPLKKQTIWSKKACTLLRAVSRIVKARNESRWQWSLVHQIHRHAKNILNRWEYTLIYCILGCVSHVSLQFHVSWFSCWFTPSNRPNHPNITPNIPSQARPVTPHPPGWLTLDSSGLLDVSNILTPQKSTDTAKTTNKTSWKLHNVGKLVKQCHFHHPPISITIFIVGMVQTIPSDGWWHWFTHNSSGLFGLIAPNSYLHLPSNSLPPKWNGCLVITGSLPFGMFFDAYLDIKAKGLPFCQGDVYFKRILIAHNSRNQPILVGYNIYIYIIIYYIT